MGSGATVMTGKIDRKRQQTERRIRVTQAHEAARIIVASCRAGQRVEKRKEQARELAKRGIRRRIRLYPRGQKQAPDMTPAFGKLWRTANHFPDEYRKIWGGKVPGGLEMKEEGERWSDRGDEQAASKGTRSKGMKGAIARWAKHKFKSPRHMEEGRPYWPLEDSSEASEVWRDGGKGLSKDGPSSDVTAYGVADHHATNNGATAVGLDYTPVQHQGTSTASSHQLAQGDSGDTQTPMQGNPKAGVYRLELGAKNAPLPPLDGLGRSPPRSDHLGRPTDIPEPTAVHTRGRDNPFSNP
ncbi:hypothetical protein B0J18DRAFT_425744 [Chaetomium sp. MPI-SDFR-AT-0129]|nr:hypothetical protein B0J18DRAFT_425744 [Chaetomium sp. MPI-SDFR-AT-0129]